MVKFYNNTAFGPIRCWNFGAPKRMHLLLNSENSGQVWKKNQIIHVLCKISQLWKFSNNSKDVRNLHKNFTIAVNPCFVTHIFKNDRKENISSHMIYLKCKINIFAVILFFPDLLDFFPQIKKKNWNTVFIVVAFYFPKLFQCGRVWFLTKWFCQHSL